MYLSDINFNVNNKKISLIPILWDHSDLFCWKFLIKNAGNVFIWRFLTLKINKPYFVRFFKMFQFLSILVQSSSQSYLFLVSIWDRNIAWLSKTREVIVRTALSSKKCLNYIWCCSFFGTKAFFTLYCAPLIHFFYLCGPRHLWKCDPQIYFSLRPMDYRIYSCWGRCATKKLREDMAELRQGIL